MENRERLSSRLGFILLSAGCAIGCGNVWKFPWLTGQNGGGIFVLIGLFVVIPATGGFGVAWTLFAAAITGFNLYAAYGKNKNGS